MDAVSRTHSAEQILRDFKACTLAERITDQLRDQEEANRIYVAVTLQPEKVLWQGLRDRVSLVNALCKSAGVRRVAALVDDDLLQDCARKCLLPYIDMPSQVTRDRLRWSLSVLRGQEGDIRRLYVDREPNAAYESLRTMTTDQDAAHFLLLQAKGETVPHSYPRGALRCAIRLGWLDFADAFIEERLGLAFHDLLRELGEPMMLMALAWMAANVCHDDPRCGDACRAFADCHFLVEGFV